MGLDVELFRIEQEGARRTVEPAAVGDTRGRFAAAVERIQHRGTTPTLERADPCGVLELSWDEMPQFVSEVDQMLAAAPDDPEREVLVAVRGLAERCGTDRTSGLRLIGD